MKTLEQIKNDYAVSKGCRNWYELEYYDGITDKDWKRVCVIAQKECLKLASENAETIKSGNSGSWYDAIVNKRSITNENNIIK